MGPVDAADPPDASPPSDPDQRSSRHAADDNAHGEYRVVNNRGKSVLDPCKMVTIEIPLHRAFPSVTPGVSDLGYQKSDVNLFIRPQLPKLTCSPPISASEWIPGSCSIKVIKSRCSSDLVRVSATSTPILESDNLPICGWSQYRDSIIQEEHRVPLTLRTHLVRRPLVALNQEQLFDPLTSRTHALRRPLSIPVPLRRSHSTMQGKYGQINEARKSVHDAPICDRNPASPFHSHGPSRVQL